MPSGEQSEVLVSGVNEFAGAIEGLKERMRIAARNIVTEGALILADAMKEQYRARPGGSRRVSHITGKVYYAGAPNFPASPPNPTIRTGNTLNSIRPRKIGPINIDTWMSQTGPGTSYERYPELGTKFIRVPFPMVKMGIENSEERLQALAEAEWAEAEGV